LIKGFQIKNRIFQDTQIGQLKYIQEFYSNYKKHSHDQFSICAIAEGKVEIEFQDKKEILFPDQLLILHKDEVHRSRNLLDKTKGYYVFYFENSCIQKLNFDNIIKDKEGYKLFIVLCQTILNEEETQEKLESFYRYLAKFRIDKSDTQENELIKKIQNYLDRNLHFELSLDDIEKEFHYSKEHIIRLFKKELGLTPHAYIINQKLNFSKRLLFSKEFTSISQVSQECGFFDQSHFSKSFKSIYAVSPNKFLEFKNR